MPPDWSPVAIFAKALRWIGPGLVLALTMIALLLSFRLEAARAALEAERRARATDHANYAQAQAEAVQRALAAKLEREKEDARQAQVAQAAFDDLRRRYDGIVRAKAAGGAGGRPDLSRAPSTPGVPADSTTGSGIPFGSIAISVDDALICGENTAYATAAHEWAKGMAQRAVERVCPIN